MTERNPALKGQRGGPGRGQGRKPGVPNKATIERALQAANAKAEAKANGKKLAKELLQDYMFAFHAVAAFYQRTLVEALQAGLPLSPEVVNNFKEWGTLVTKTAADLAPYESPTFRAIGVMAPNPDLRPGDDAKTVGGSSKKLTAIEASRAYRQLMQTAVGAAIDDD